MTHRWIEGSIDFLERAYDPESGLFSYSSSLTGGRFTNDFEHPAVVRYSVNSLLGLQEARRHEHGGKAVGRFDEMLDRFLDKQWSAVEDWGDRGLLLYVLVREQRTDRSMELLPRITTFVNDSKAEGLDLQSVSWLLWGVSAAASAGLDGAETLAHKLFRILHSRYLHRDSLLARHSAQGYRKNLVSFGGTAYYLRALHEYGSFANNEYALTVFDWVVRRVMGLQGPLGEWPWMFKVSAAAIVDPYPVFSVHQDSMAMLFLLPALDRGVDGVAESISRSCKWVEGNNELSTNLVTDEPFFISRSIQRVERAPRARRYIRSLGKTRDSWARAPRKSLEVNPESRSYHLAWILFVWSGREDVLTSALQETGSE